MGLTITLAILLCCAADLAGKISGYIYIYIYLYNKINKHTRKVTQNKKKKLRICSLVLIEGSIGSKK